MTNTGRMEGCEKRRTALEKQRVPSEKRWMILEKLEPTEMSDPQKMSGSPRERVNACGFINTPPHVQHHSREGGQPDGPWLDWWETVTTDTGVSVITASPDIATGWPKRKPCRCYILLLSHASAVALLWRKGFPALSIHPWLRSLNLPLPHAWTLSRGLPSLLPPTPRGLARKGQLVELLFSTGYGSTGCRSRWASRCRFQILVWLGSPKSVSAVYRAGLQRIARGRLSLGLVHGGDSYQV
jgi:hypothetical protein